MYLKAFVAFALFIVLAVADYRTDTIENFAELCEKEGCSVPPYTPETPSRKRYISERTACKSKGVFAAKNDNCGSSGGHVMWTKFSSAKPSGLGTDRWSSKKIDGTWSVTFLEYHDSATLTREGDTARLFGDLYGNNDDTNRWWIDVPLIRVREGVNKVEIGCRQAELTATWFYYAIPNGQEGILVGKGRNAGINITFTFETSFTMPFTVGLGASQKNVKAGASSWIKYKTFSIDESVPENEKINLARPNTHSDGDLNFNFECDCTCPEEDQPVCGDGTVDEGEECDDSTNPCCHNCEYASDDTVCRAAAGDCDIPETCTGESTVCPDDEFKDNTVVCEEMWGMCDVQIQSHCPGNAPRCDGPPLVPMYQGVYNWNQFNAISFLDFFSDGGDVQGRVAVARNMNVSGFTIGLTLNTGEGGTDTPMPYSLYVGHNATWNGGNLHPEGADGSTSGREDAFVGDTFTAPDDLQKRREGHSLVIGDQDPYFEAYQSYYTTIQNHFASLPENAQWEVVYGDGLSVTCDAIDSLLYHIKVPGDVISQINWYPLQNCNIHARWVITVTGDGDFEIKGSTFPGVVERLIYNIIGEGRTIFSTTGINANVLAPNNFFDQPAGVTLGVIVFGNIIRLRQANKPNCVDFAPFKITTRTTEPTYVGWKKIYVLSFNGVRPGDLFCWDGHCQPVVALQVEEEEEKKVVVVQDPLTEDLNGEQSINFIASYDEQRSNTDPVSEWDGYETIPAEQPSSAAAVVLGAATLVALAQF